MSVSAKSDFIPTPKLAFVFSGIGSQWPGMGEELMQYPVFQQTLEECDQAFHPLAGWSILEELQKEPTASRLSDSTIGAPCVCALEIALFDLLRSWGLQPAGVLGHSVGEIVGELITRHRGIRPGPARDEMVADLLERVGLGSFVMERLPDELSGGQRQRVAIARALSVEPRLIVCDEPTSALDVSIQSQIINLLADLQANAGLTYLFITHNLAMARHISHNLAVMYLGYLVESGPTERVFARPAHPYTEMLLASSPVPDPAHQRERAASRRRINRSADPGIAVAVTGCPFANRCPSVMDVCRRTMPVQTKVIGGGSVRCHAHTAGATLGRVNQ